MDMCLAEVIGQKGSATTRPRMDAVAAWLAARTDFEDRVEACVFANVGAEHEESLARWVANLRQWGWSVFVKPKIQRRDDIDDEMIRYIERRFHQGALVELIVASHDARAFTGPLTRYAQAGVRVSVLGFRERERLASANPIVEFIDLESVPGSFETPLPRTNLYDLPAGGRWFHTFTALNGTRADPVGPGEDQHPHTDAAGHTSSPIPSDSNTVAQPLAEITENPATPADTWRGGRARDGDEDGEGPSLDPADEPAAGPRPTRTQVADFLRAAATDAEGRSISLKQAAALLRDHFAGFSLLSAGYVSVADLLNELQTGNAIEVTRSGDGHHLTARPSTVDDQRGAVDPNHQPTPPAEPTGTESLLKWLSADDSPDVIDLTLSPPVATEVAPQPQREVEGEEGDEGGLAQLIVLAEPVDMDEQPVSAPNQIYRVFGYDPNRP